MNQTHFEHQLRRQFAEWRAQDAAQAPPCARLLARANQQLSGPVHPQLRVGRIGAALVFALALAGVWWGLRQRSSSPADRWLAFGTRPIQAADTASQVPWQSEVLLSRWQAPSDILLQAWAGDWAQLSLDLPAANRGDLTPRSVDHQTNPSRNP